MTPAAGDVTIVVLAGGQSRRFGSDKLAAPMEGSTVLDHLLESLPARWPAVVVGEPRSTRRMVTWTREDPPDGGPLAGIQAGLECVDTDLVAVVAGDMPYAAAALPALLAALGEAGARTDAACARDDTGQVNPLLALYRTSSLREFMPRPAHGRPARTLLTMSHVEVPVSGVASRDVDTPADLTQISAQVALGE